MKQTGWKTFSVLLVVFPCLTWVGCSPPAADPDVVQPEAEPAPQTALAQSGPTTIAKPPIRGRFRVEELPFDIVVFETVFWEPRDTSSLRKLIQDTELVKDRTVMEIGTGSGLVALCCLHAKASRVLATDVNPNAIANARYNAEMLKLLDSLETRRVSLEESTAFAILQPHERFDLIISNPPWEDSQPKTIDEYALYDQGFRLLESLLDELPERLNPGGKALLAYGNVTAIRTVIDRAPRHNLNVKILDQRDLDDLPENFLPGMLLEVRPNPAEVSRPG